MSLLDDAVTVTVTGAKITTSGTSQSVQIPNDSAGNLPRYIRVSATAPACVKLGTSAVTATTNDMQVQPGDSVKMSTNGYTYIAAIQVSAAGQVQISPLENV